MLKIRRWSDGECVGFLSRNVGEITPERPKYRFAEGFQKSLELFGCCELREDHKIPLRIVYVVESPFCVLKFWQMGFPAVSPFGCSVSEKQAEMIGQLAKGAVLLLDRDKEGQAAPVVHVLSRRVWVKCPGLPDNVADPEHLSEVQIRSLTAERQLRRLFAW